MKNKIVELIGYTLAFILIAIIALFFIAIAKWSVKTVFGAEEVVTEDYTVSAGETLWEIASENKKDGQDVREYIYELRKLNNIDDCIIYPGQVIKIIK